ncbi:hypothetical protein AVEN_71711-1 [Araneus ventricosus]|uniref:Uncharacterized protein n=1 Tax=Araneus ventricosus TaxID=182803 RepID=A0A4Y2FV54_ARAVE|nr:hypothetical protein AVEN_71711-1 [Araneus ventricosus]
MCQIECAPKRAWNHNRFKETLIRVTHFLRWYLFILLSFSPQLRGGRRGAGEAGLPLRLPHPAEGGGLRGRAEAQRRVPGFSTSHKLCRREFIVWSNKNSSRNHSFTIPHKAFEKNAVE